MAERKAESRGRGHRHVFEFATTGPGRDGAPARRAAGVAGMVWGIVATTPYPALFHGQSVWTRLPFWLQGAYIGGLVLVAAGGVLQAAAAIVGMQGTQRRANSLLAAASGLSLAVAVAGFVAPAGTFGTGLLGSCEQMGNHGPGLRRPATESLQLPVPRVFDLSHVEPAHFAAALGKDPSRIFQYVRDQIGYEAYTGCERVRQRIEKRNDIESATGVNEPHQFLRRGW